MHAELSALHKCAQIKCEVKAELAASTKHYKIKIIYHTKMEGFMRQYTIRVDGYLLAYNIMHGWAADLVEACRRENEVLTYTEL